MDKLVADKEAITVQLTSDKTQVQGIKAKGLAQDKKIEELEAELGRAWAEAAQSQAEVEKTKVMTYKTIFVYVRDDAAEGAL